MTRIMTDKILLNGEWQYIEDAECSLSFEDVKLASSNPVMKVPTNWQLDGLNNFNGSVWFLKKFSLPNTTSNDIKVIKFYGVDYFADVWLNDIHLGHHEGYFQPFYFNITDFVKEENQLVVKVKSPKEDTETTWPYKKKLIKGIFNHHDCRPGGWDKEHGQDQNTGGIWNKIELEYGKKIFIDNTKITSKLIDDYTSSIILSEVEYESSLRTETLLKLKTELLHPSGEKEENDFDVIVKPGKNKFSFSFTIKNPELWWSWDLGEQNLYQLKLSDEEFNEVNTTFGIKEVKLNEKSEFFLNAKRLFLRGTNIIPTQFLSDLTEEKIYNQISLMKQANINVVRVHAHVNRKEFYDECDKQGILVWQDFALQWTYDESETFVINAVNQIKDMIKLHYNHPSIAFWCCHNEPGEQINTLDRFLYDAVMSEDNSRIIRKASNYEEHPYDGWYWGKTEHFEAAPMGPLVTEFGAQALPELNSLKKFFPDESLYPPDWKNWKYHNFQFVQTFMIAKINKGNNIYEFIKNSQEYQSLLLRTAIDSYRRKKNSGIAGIFQFMFIDCWPSITWSVVDYYGIKKKGYDTLKTAYQPLYLSVKLRQDKYNKGDKLNLEFWLINDLQKEFNNIKIAVSIAGEIISEINNLNVKADSLMKFEWEQLQLTLPENLSSEKHKLLFEIVNQTSTATVSCNQSEIEIVD